MTLILLGALPFLFLIAFFVNKKAAPYKAIREQAWQQSSGILEETLSGNHLRISYQSVGASHTRMLNNPVCISCTQAVKALPHLSQLLRISMH